MSEPLQKVQNLLRELFEFDCADLDFGIYRIMNHKRQVIERFITEDLPKAIAEELRSGALTGTLSRFLLNAPNDCLNLIQCLNGPQMSGWALALKIRITPSVLTA